jgi:murein DD-endopeptidase MepM/ murein hydrolase activator NlpD
MAGDDKKTFIRRLKNRYRLVIMNDETLEEKASFNLRPLKVFVTAGLIIILLITVTTFIIAFTGLREYIPGYADVKTQWRVYNLAMKADSMEEKLQTRDKFLENLKNVISGNVSAEPVTHSVDREKESKYDTIHKLYKSREDAELRKLIETQSNTISSQSPGSDANSFLFFPPLKGTVTNRFDAVKKHYGIDVVAEPNRAIKSTLDGTVVF